MKNKTEPSVAIVMGSDSDAPVMKEALQALKEFGIPAHVEVISAHRTPEKMMNWAKTAHENGFKIIIAGAGGAAHLPGMIASLTPLPVIGVPVSLKNLSGLDSLLSIVQMPKGIPVATVAIDNAYNAGILAARILGIQDSKIKIELLEYSKKQEKKVKTMNENLTNLITK